MSEHPRSRQRANFIAYASAGLIVLVCLFSHLGAIGLVGPDEPRYAWIARAMATSGDWVTPRLYGQPWFEKPVLYYWAAALGFLAHLPAEWAARLPSAIAALVAAIAIGWLGWKFTARTSWPFASPLLIAPLIFSTSVAAIGFARAAGPDMLFSAALTLAMASGAIVLSRRGALRSENENRAITGPSDHFALAFFGASLGLAVLAKGPAGVVLAAGAIGIWAARDERSGADALRLAHPIAIARSALLHCRGTCFAPRATPISSTYLFFSIISNDTSLLCFSIASRFGISSRFFCSDCFPGQRAFGQRSKKDCDSGGRNPGAIRRDSFSPAGRFSLFCFLAFRNRNYRDTSFRPFLRSLF